MGRGWRKGVVLREEGRFAAVWVAEEEDGDGWGIIVHEQLPIDWIHRLWSLHFYKALIT